MRAAPLIDSAPGEATGLAIPAHEQALRAAGEAFLTRAFRAFGSLGPENGVRRITRIEPCTGGSTGQKLFLSVEYERPAPDLHTELFVKFSRDFTDPLRDRGRHEMEAEVRFAAVSRRPGFPISVPTAYFADYDPKSGTGILITERIAFGEDGVEPHRVKFLDYELDEPVAYYRVLVRALARLAGAHRSGQLSSDVDILFPYHPEHAGAQDRIPYDAAGLSELVAQYAAFAAAFPQLLPAEAATPDFIARFDREAVRFLQHEARIRRFLDGDADLVALCHWNAQIDNAWFWRSPSGDLDCGLMDWGRVSQLNVAFALWGCLGGAPLDVWDRHLDELLELFVTEFARRGGPQLDADDLRLHMDLYVATMGLAWLMESPARIRACLPDGAALAGPRDSAIRDSETARGFLGIFTAFVHLWRTHDFGASLDRMLKRLDPDVLAARS